MKLDLDLAFWEQQTEQIQRALFDEESAQRVVEREIDLEVGPVREQVAAMLGEIERLELRLYRLEASSQPLSDDELDEEEFDERAESAAFWAEWRQQREERPNPNGRRQPPRNIARRNPKLRERYRALARLIHPDLTADPEARAHRESIMRLANEAYEIGDQTQIDRLLELWTRPDKRGNATLSLDERYKLVAQKRSEHEELRRELRNLERSDLGKLMRAHPRTRRRDIQKDAERLRRELASLRLRRRRLLRTLNSLREELTEISD
ncbi:hypothetical protein BH23CHL2_BH23CHL2_18740 [soil metagenome]